MIAFEHVYMSFGDINVLNDMDLELEREGITCLLGSSGCGKSTALRIASGLSKPDAGQVFISASACGVVFQDNRLLPWLTTYQNLSLAIPSLKRRGAVMESIFHELKNVSLDPHHVTDLLPGELSGGMAQRVCIVRALLRNPQYLMMDEPFAALDALTRKELQIMLKGLVKSRGIACLFVTHDIEEAFTIAERILVMRGGRTVRSYYRNNFENWAQREAVTDDILNILGRKRS